VLGIDERSREVLSFIPGVTLNRVPWPQWVWHDALLKQAAEALAAYHLAVADFRPITVESRLGSDLLDDGEIVCHNDFAPYNCAFRNGQLTGVLDWDVVCAGRSAWDVAFFAWHWVPLHAPSPGLEWRTVPECPRRLCLAADTNASTTQRNLSISSSRGSKPVDVGSSKGRRRVTRHSCGSRKAATPRRLRRTLEFIADIGPSLRAALRR